MCKSNPEFLVVVKFQCQGQFQSILQSLFTNPKYLIQSWFAAKWRQKGWARFQKVKYQNANFQIYVIINLAQIFLICYKIFRVYIGFLNPKIVLYKIKESFFWENILKHNRKCLWWDTNPDKGDGSQWENNFYTK